MDLVKIGCMAIILICLSVFTGAILSVFIPEIRPPQLGGGHRLTPEQAAKLLHNRNH